jgi:hypothetical protein
MFSLSVLMPALLPFGHLSLLFTADKGKNVTHFLFLLHFSVHIVERYVSRICEG